MEIQLSELRRIFEREEIDNENRQERMSGNGSCSTLINQLYGEPLFLALFAECLSTHTGHMWNYSLGEAFVARVSGERSNRKRLDGYIFSNGSTGTFPKLFACEVKGWSDHCLGGFRIPKSPRKRESQPAKGIYYWRGLAEHFKQATDGRKEGVLCKMDAKWHPPESLVSQESECSIGLAMFHLLEPPADAANIEWPFSGTRSIFWFATPDFEEHRHVLVFSIAKYLRERESDVFVLNDPAVEFRISALRRTGAI
jgi:hypothetical protein